MRKEIEKIALSIWVPLAIAVLFSCGNGKGTKVDNPLIANQSSQKIMIYAAASLTDVLMDIVDSFQVETGIKVITNMASSGTLARQIEQGGTPDIYISASKKWADYVDSLDFVIQTFKMEVAKNELVLISPADSKQDSVTINESLDFSTLLGKNRLSMGDPSHVPAGKYAKQSLEYFGWYGSIGKDVLPAKDVRSALMVVELGEVPLGIVYKTDAQKSTKVRIIGTFPEESHKPIVYVAELCKDNSNAKAFYNYLSSDKMKVVWNRYGFRE